MAEDDFLAPSLGHNRPPAPTPLDRAGELVANANRWVAERPSISDEETAGLGQGFVQQLRDCRADLEAALEKEREPLDLALYAVKVRYKDPLAMIDIALGKMGALLAPFLKAKDDRLRAEAEQRQRLADEAQQRAEHALERARATGTVEDQLAMERAAEEAEAARKAAGRPAKRAQVKGDYAPRAMSLKTYWHAEVTDADAALAHYGNDASVRLAALAAATKIASALARELKDERRAPPGFKFVKREVPQ
jgi:hypothetical protein